jgi:hypothetical protein
MEVGFDDAEFVLVSVQKSGGRCNEKCVVVQLSICSDSPAHEGCVKKVILPPPHSSCTLEVFMYERWISLMYPSSVANSQLQMSGGQNLARSPWCGRWAG